MQQFIDNELRYGLGVAVEAKIVADINGTSGIQTQAYSTSVLQTLRKSITKLEANGYPPGSIVLHPNDWEGVELALSIDERCRTLELAVRSGEPSPVRCARRDDSQRRRRVASHVLAQGAVAVDTDTQGVGVQWSENQQR